MTYLHTRFTSQKKAQGCSGIYTERRQRRHYGCLQRFIGGLNVEDMKPWYGLRTSTRSILHGRVDGLGKGAKKKQGSDGRRSEWI